MALAGIRRLVGQIKAIEKNDLLPSEEYEDRAHERKHRRLHLRPNHLFQGLDL